MDITAIPNTQWRNEMLPASFRGRYFHCFSNATNGGERVVTHQFPKKDYPYTEKMGRHAMEFSIRGYVIAYPKNTVGDPLKQRDYRQARDALKAVLDDGNEGLLQLPTQQPMTVVCTRYSLTEEERLGGYCTFDMTFVELGSSPLEYTPDTQSSVFQSSMELRFQALQAWTPDSIPPDAQKQVDNAIFSGSTQKVAEAWKNVMQAYHDNPAAFAGS